MTHQREHANAFKVPTIIDGDHYVHLYETSSRVDHLDVGFTRLHLPNGTVIASQCPIYGRYLVIPGSDIEDATRDDVWIIERRPNAAGRLDAETRKAAEAMGLHVEP